jgi:hypothetical protein
VYLIMKGPKGHRQPATAIMSRFAVVSYLDTETTQFI